MIVELTENEIFYIFSSLVFHELDVDFVTEEHKKLTKRFEQIYAKFIVEKKDEREEKELDSGGHQEAGGIAQGTRRRRREDHTGQKAHHCC